MVRELCYGNVGRQAPCLCIELSNYVPLHVFATLTCGCKLVSCVAYLEWESNVQLVNNAPRFKRVAGVSCGGFRRPRMPRVSVVAVDNGASSFLFGAE
jgi:hypothetical protein